MSPDYFFSMDLFEVTTYMEGLKEKEKSELERVRLIMWASLVPHSKKSLDLEDVLRIEGTATETKEDKEQQKKEMEALIKRAKKMEEMMNGKHIH